VELVLSEHFNLSERILKVIEKAIISGSIKPGERINETEIARSLGTSKSPVREALKRLEGEGIVEPLPRKGYFVRKIDRERIEEFFDIITIIEPAIVRMSLRKGSRGVWRKIDGFIKDMERELRKRDYDEYLVLNDEFHTYFYELTENEWAIKISQMLRKQATMLRSLSLYTRNRFSASIVEHRAIAEAYKSGDSGQLTKAVENHLLRFKENIIQSDLLKSGEKGQVEPKSNSFI